MVCLRNASDVSSKGTVRVRHQTTCPYCGPTTYDAEEKLPLPYPIFYAHHTTSPALILKATRGETDVRNQGGTRTKSAELTAAQTSRLSSFLGLLCSRPSRVAKPDSVRVSGRLSVFEPDRARYQPRRPSSCRGRSPPSLSAN